MFVERRSEYSTFPIKSGVWEVQKGLRRINIKYLWSRTLQQLFYVSGQLSFNIIRVCSYPKKIDSM